MLDHYFLLDTSYLVYISSFRAFKNYVAQLHISKSKLGPTFDPTIDEEYTNYLNKCLRECIIYVASQSVPFIDKSKFIFALDCPRKNIWRREIFPAYKLQRDTKDTSKDNYDIGKCFNYAYKYIIPSICEDYNCISVLCGCAEADDIIAVLSRYLSETLNHKCTIISSDRDMIQLCSSNISLITAEGKIRTPKDDLEKLTLTKFKGRDITAQDFLLFKILIGDPADNIPNVKQGIGKKKALNYIFNKKALKELLTEDKLYLDSFCRNKSLISMKDIPNDIQTMIIEEYNNKIKERNEKALFIE